MLNCECWNNFFYYVGLATSTLLAIHFTRKFYNNIGTFFFKLGEVDYKSYGKWAVVTGATDGIGKAYAEQLAERGCNIVLLSRTLSKLEALAEELRNKYKVEVKVVAANFTDPTGIYDNIRSELSGLDIGVLVNNVGMAPPRLCYFGEIEQFGSSHIDDLVNCNTISMTKMTNIVLPGMISKRKGIIINFSSAGGRHPLPNTAIYSATKSYADFFSRGLALEYGSKGIIVQSVCPFEVLTKMVKFGNENVVQKESFVSPFPDTFVRAALKTVGSQPVTNGCFGHSIQGWVFENMPLWLKRITIFKIAERMKQESMKKK